MFNLKEFNENDLVESLFKLISQGKQLSVSFVARTDFQRQLLPAIKKSKSIVLTGIDVQISDKYHVFDIEDMAPIKEAVTDAISSGNIDSFLLNHLVLIGDDFKGKVPVFTVLDRIRDRWRFLLEEYKIPYNSVFLDGLTSRWYFLVNLYGIPLRKEDVFQFYSYLLEHKS